MADITKVKSGDPEQCQAITAYGQCLNKKVPHGTTCPIHGGVSAERSYEKSQAKLYRLSKYSARLDEMNGHNKLKSLTSEIGILRILMEEYFDKIGNDKVALLQFAPNIADLAIKIERLVTSCTKLDKYLGQYLDKADASQLGIEIVAIIGHHIQDSEVLDAINTEIIAAIERLGKAGEES